jgi:hypothetical protein
MKSMFQPLEGFIDVSFPEARKHQVGLAIEHIETRRSLNQKTKRGEKGDVGSKTI